MFLDHTFVEELELKLKYGILKAPLFLKGVGLHTGQSTCLKLFPLDRGAGWRWITKYGRSIPLRNLSVEKSHWTTALKTPEGQNILGLEHVLGVLNGLLILDVGIQLIGHEVPLGDGSGSWIWKKIQKSGVVWQTGVARVYRLLHPLQCQREHAVIQIIPSLNRAVSMHLSFKDRSKTWGWAFHWKGDFKTFKQKILLARTFAFESWIPSLRQQGLIRGGSLENAVVIRDGKPLMGAWRMQDEPACHKILDLLGDMALLARPLWANIQAHRTGHQLNLQCMSKIIGSEQ